MKWPSFILALLSFLALACTGCSSTRRGTESGGGGGLGGGGGGGPVGSSGLPKDELAREASPDDVAKFCEWFVGLPNAQKLIPCGDNPPHEPEGSVSDCLASYEPGLFASCDVRIGDLEECAIQSDRDPCGDPPACAVIANDCVADVECLANLPAEAWCNGFPDCPNGVDELGC